MPARRTIKPKQLTQAQLFYIVNHLNVLGLQRGLPIVANKLQESESQVKHAYELAKKKERENSASN